MSKFKIGDIIHTKSSDLILEIIKIPENNLYMVKCLRAINYRTRMWNAGDTASIGKLNIENQCELDEDYLLDLKLREL